MVKQSGFLHMGLHFKVIRMQANTPLWELHRQVSGHLALLASKVDHHHHLAQQVFHVWFLHLGRKQASMVEQRTWLLELNCLFALPLH